MYQNVFGASASDDFNRANGALGSNWTDHGEGGLVITGNTVAGANAGNTGDYWAGAAFGSDQYSQVEVTSTQISGGEWIGPSVRVANSGQDGYLGLYWWNNGTPVLMMFKRQSGGWTQLGNTYSSGALAAGTQLKLTAVGSTITFLQDGVARITATDTGLTGGAPGIMSYGQGSADNWAGGDVSAPSTYTIGGTVSGLSGSVLLQDNNSDDLTVTANGSFTFATHLATGAAYNVTVKTNPAGQTCSVSNGSGTVASANVTNVAVTCANSGTFSDDFNRADGSLGSNWTDFSDGGLAITGNAVAGTTTGNTGDYFSAGTFGSDQSSQVQVSSTQLTGGQWIGPTVRTQNNGLDNYLGLYWWNNGTPVMMLFKRQGGNWTQLGNTYSSGALAAGTDLKLLVTGSSITFSQDGVARITATDTSLTGGKPGIMSYGTGQVDNWTGSSLSAPSTYTVGGTVSGASGAVVLQDNGGDNLTVPANGGFTFATALATGAAYNVTVQTNPTGQTCSVTNGSGTIASANITNVTVTCSTSGPGGFSDDFNRADGSLGSNWTDHGEGGLTITGNEVAGTQATATTGDYWAGGSVSSDQYSQVQLTSNQPTGGMWIGPSVRVQNSGQSGYLGIYFWNNGAPDLMLFKRQGGSWTQLGSTYNSGALPAGTNLQLSVTGSSITFSQDGVSRITATDASLVGGAPGVMSYGTGHIDNWTGGNTQTGPSYTVGGTVSGLSGGTLVLENNGYDDKSITANGSYTFNNPVNSGSTYSVVVKTNPSGQSCTVSNGSGTMGSANVTNVDVTCQVNSGSGGTDDFNRANGPLGPSWTDESDGGLVISNNAAAGSSAATTGSYRTAETYSSNQYSQVEVTSTQLTGGQWIGPSVRVQNSGQNGYLGIYYWNNGNPELMMFKRTGTSWGQIGNTYACGALAAGTQLKLEAVGDSVAFLENGVERISASDATYAGGAPGIMSYGTGMVDNWSGGTAGFQVNYLSTDANGVASYDVISANSGYGPQVLRVLQPDNPAPGVPHNFIYTLPVAPGADNTVFGDGLDYLKSLNAQNQYNLTIVEPSFGIDPWYADNPTNTEHEETLLTTEIEPWVMNHLTSSGTEQNWLIGFSKSGIGGADLLLKHPGLFSVGAFWDWPADISTYDQFGASSANSYGTDANFQSNYRLTQSFVDAHKAPFTGSNRIWIGGYNAFQTDVTDFNTLLTNEGMQHTLGTMQYITHSWTSGWVPEALAALAQDSAGQ